MGLLDDLKNQTADLKAREQRDREREAQQEAFFRDVIRPRLESIYGYLHQFVEQLNYLQPDISVDYTLPGDIALSGLAQGDYSLKVDSRENMSEVVLRFYCQTEGEVFFAVEHKGQFDKLRDIFHQSRLRYQTRTNKDAKQTVLGGDFTLEKVVPIVFSVYQADIENSSIILWIRNFEDLGLRRFVLPPKKSTIPFWTISASISCARSTPLCDWISRKTLSTRFATSSNRASCRRNWKSDWPRNASCGSNRSGTREKNRLPRQATAEGHLQQGQKVTRVNTTPPATRARITPPACPARAFRNPARRHHWHSVSGHRTFP